MATIHPVGRTATPPSQGHEGPVTLINGFMVPAGREAAFAELWAGTSQYFRNKPGFLSLRMHKSVSPDAHFRFVNVAEWASLEQFKTAHDTDQFRALVSRPEWREFPSQPSLYQIHAEFQAPPASAA